MSEKPLGNDSEVQTISRVDEMVQRFQHVLSLFAALLDNAEQSKHMAYIAFDYKVLKRA